MAIWVFTGVIMLLIQVILGGITRLTGSGLSITHWDVITGALPPLNAAQWQEKFDGYRQTEQFRVLNSGFSLADFKFIFFWEWFHRFWARMVGVVFLVGFAGLVWKKKMKKEMVRPLLILFLLGAMQGAIGWIMVASGFTGDAIYVEPTRLALHFVFALGLVVYAFWFALQLSVPPEALLARRGVKPDDGRALDSGEGLDNGGKSLDSREGLAALRGWTIAILFILFFQLSYGALMAGHKAAAVASTWPRINGDWVPPSLFTKSPLATDLIGNKITVQFIHRGLAYLLLVMVGIWSVLAVRLGGTPVWFHKLRWLPLLLIGVQIILGITSLLTSPGITPGRWVSFDWLAQFHQVTGLLFLLTIIGMLYLVKPIRYPVTV